MATDGKCRTSPLIRRHHLRSRFHRPSLEIVATATRRAIAKTIRINDTGGFFSGAAHLLQKSSRPCESTGSAVARLNRADAATRCRRNAMDDVVLGLPGNTSLASKYMR